MRDGKKETNWIVGKLDCGEPDQSLTNSKPDRERELPFMGRSLTPPKGRAKVFIGLDGFKNVYVCSVLLKRQVDTSRGSVQGGLAI